MRLPIPPPDYKLHKLVKFSLRVYSYNEHFHTPTTIVSYVTPLTSLALFLIYVMLNETILQFLQMVCSPFPVTGQ